MTMIQYLTQINEYIIKMNISMPLIILLIIVLLPIVLIVMLCYSGVYYHLWYFPALMLSLFVLKKWKEKYKLNYLFIISFFYYYLEQQKHIMDCFHFLLKNLLHIILISFLQHVIFYFLDYSMWFWDIRWG